MKTEKMGVHPTHSKAFHLRQQALEESEKIEEMGEFAEHETIITAPKKTAPHHHKNIQNPESLDFGAFDKETQENAATPDEVAEYIAEQNTRIQKERN